jgi:hypothetical protein
MRQSMLQRGLFWAGAVVIAIASGYLITSSMLASHHATVQRWDGGYDGIIQSSSRTSWKLDEINDDNTSTMTVKIYSVAYGGEKPAQLILPVGKKVGTKVHFWQDAAGNRSTTMEDDTPPFASLIGGASLGLLLGLLWMILFTAVRPRDYWWLSSRRWWNRLNRRLVRQTA